MESSPSSTTPYRLSVPLLFLLSTIVIGVQSQPPPAPSPRGSASGRYLPLPDQRKISQMLPPRQWQMYTFRVPPASSLSITVFPCQGHVSWNITYVGARMFTHPKYPTGKRRKKRCCVTAGVTHNFNFNIAGLPSGLGTSMGDGAITYFLEDSSGGIYYMALANNSPTVARYEIFATLRPEESPYVQLPNDAQLKVTAIRETELAISWMPVGPEPVPARYVVYCIEVHKSAERRDDDVKSSTCASHRSRPTTKQEVCTTDTDHTIRGLEPSTQYSIDVYARNRKENTETAYLSVTAATAGSSPVAVRNLTSYSTLMPHQTRVFSMAAPQRSQMLMGVSTCSGRLKWSVLDSDGRSVRDYVQGPTPGMQLDQGMNNFVNSLPATDQQYVSNVESQDRFSIAVSNLNPHEPTSFEIYAATDQHRNGYPLMPANRQVMLGAVGPTSVSLRWRPVANSVNITYCVHVNPHNAALRNKVVHSACGLGIAEQRRVISSGRCLSMPLRTISGLAPSMWYDIDVVAKNTFSRRHQAYTGILVFTRTVQAHQFNSNRNDLKLRRLFYSSTSRVLPQLSLLVLGALAVGVIISR